MPSENKGNALEPPALEPPLDPRPTPSITPTPLGTLSTLPRELRDEIYGHVISQTYNSTIHPLDANLKWSGYAHWSEELPTIQLSKAIRQEFLTILFSKTEFIFDYLSPARMTVWKREGSPFIDQILSVAFIIYPRDRAERMAKSVEFFTGPEILRNKCYIGLYLIAPSEVLGTHSSVTTAIKGLIGFKIITVRLHLVDGQLAANYGDIANALRSELEPSLGPSIITGRDWDKGVGSELTFRPRDYLARKNKGQVISSGSRDEGNGSLPQMGNS